MKFVDDKVKEITGRKKNRIVVQHKLVQKYRFLHNKGGNIYRIIR
jgi:hypothetical protein